MDNIAKLPSSERGELFLRTAGQMKVPAGMIEKDFWVCWVLDALFSSADWSDKIIFKGGTSLSKVFGLISRFSEDIDLILDWGLLGYTKGDAWKDRTNTAQDKFCKEVNEKAIIFLQNVFVPKFKHELESKLGATLPIQVEKDAVIINYPQSFSHDYVKPSILLEIGPLAEWVPNKKFSIQPYAAMEFPTLFSKSSVKVMAILAERTFWEKATILHKLASQGKIPVRHSRHYYDLAQLAQSSAKNIALGKIDLLHEVIAFKQRFYRSPNAQYEKAVPGSFRLIPDANLIKELENDYDKTANLT